MSWQMNQFPNLKLAWCHFWLRGAFLLLPGFIVFHLLKLEEFLERERANFEHGRTRFVLVLLCLCRGERPVPASLPCPWSLRPSWTTARCQDIGKLWWPGRLMLGPINCDKGKLLWFLNFSFRKCDSSKSRVL